MTTPHEPDDPTPHDCAAPDDTVTEAVTLREHLAAHCKSAGTSFSRLSKDAGIPRGSLYAALRNPTESPRVIERLAEHLGTNSAFLASLPGSNGRVHAAKNEPLRELLDRVAAQRDVSRSALINSLDVPRATLYGLLSGARPTYRVVREVATALDVPVEEVLAATGRSLDPITVSLARTGARAHASATKARKTKKMRATQVQRLVSRLEDPDLARALESVRQPICDTTSSLGAALDDHASKHGMSMRQVAQAAGIVHQHLDQILTGRIGRPGATVVDGLSRVLGRTPAQVEEWIAEITPQWAAQGAALRAQRQEANLTAQGLADLCGVSGSLVSAWERGRARVPDRHQAVIDMYCVSARAAGATSNVLA